MQLTLHCDFETRSVADLKRVGADLYAKHPSTDALCMAFAFTRSGEVAKEVHLWKLGDPVSEPLQRFFTFMEDGSPVVAHNAPFELAIWNNVCTKKYKWPSLLASRVECTMASAYAMALPGSLEKAAAAVGITEQKDLAGSRVMMQLARPREITPGGEPVWWTPESAPEKFEKLYAYCTQDLRVEMELHTRLVPLSAAEKKIWLLDYYINQRGIRVALPAVKKAMQLVEYEKDRLNEEMKRTTGGSVSTCSATGQLTDWIRWQGIEVDGVAKADVLALLERDDLPEQVRKALLLRQEGNKSSTAKLSAMADAAGTDERVRGTKQYHGAGTGRWAGRRLQVDNFARGNLSGQDIDGVFELMGAN